MLSVSWDTVRLFLHVLAATIWVGGQITLAALVPVLRRLGTEIPRAAARRFNQVAWPTFGVLVLTGIWNIAAVRSQITGSYETTLIVKLIVVAVSGVTAALHARAQQDRVGGRVWRADRHQRAGRPVPRRAAGGVRSRSGVSGRRHHGRRGAQLRQAQAGLDERVEPVGAQGRAHLRECALHQAKMQRADDYAGSSPPTRGTGSAAA